MRFLLFVVAKWLLMRESRDQTLRAYVEDNQYDRSLPVGVKFIFGLLCVSIAKGSFSALVCVKVYGVEYLRADFSVVCDASSDPAYASLVAWAALGLLQILVAPALVLLLLWDAIAHRRLASSQRED